MHRSIAGWVSQYLDGTGAFGGLCLLTTTGLPICSIPEPADFIALEKRYDEISSYIYANGNCNSSWPDAADAYLFKWRITLQNARDSFCSSSKLSCSRYGHQVDRESMALNCLRIQPIISISRDPDQHSLRLLRRDRLALILGQIWSVLHSYL